MIRIYQNTNGNIIIEKEGKDKSIKALPFAFFFIHPSLDDSILLSNKTDLEDERAGIVINAKEVIKVQEIDFNGNEHELLEVISKQIKVAGTK